MWSLDKLKAKLDVLSSSGYNFDDLKSKELREAAILVPIIVKNNVPYVLLTVRSNNLSNHPGQVSFPGGKREEDENIVSTALRETQEEIGMSSKHVKILGKLLPYVTRSKYFVTPVVAEILDYEQYIPKLNPFEVCEIFTVPLEIFTLTKYRKQRQFSYGKNGEKQVILDFVEYGENSESVHVIWGLTIMIATHTASLLFERNLVSKKLTWLKDTDREIQRDKIYDKLIHNSKL